jgi:hypothetical protein
VPSDSRDYSLDIAALRPAANSSSATNRPYLSVNFACCSVYQRVYRDRDGKHYTARCPKCGKTARFAVGEGGTTARFFTVR